jgi:hypothetical protein
MAAKTERGKRGAAQLAQYKWPKGTSGNPSGRPKRLRITEDIRKYLDVEVPVAVLKRFKIPLDTKIVFSELIAMRLIDKATRGNIPAAREIADRDEGKPKQRIEILGSAGNEIKIRVVYETKNGNSRA